MIYHYTTIQNLALILDSKKIRFSRLDTLDDLEELDLSDPFNPLPYFFVSCWEKSKEENIALWHMYSDKKRGVRIGLKDPPFIFNQLLFPSNCGIDTEGTLPAPLSFEQIHTSDFCILPIFGAAFSGEVEYTKDPIAERKKHMTITDNKVHPGTHNLSISFAKLPRIKNEIWAFQNEVRFSLLILPPYNKSPDSPDFGNNLNHHLAKSVREKNLPTIPHFDLALDTAALDSIEVTLGPCAELSDELIVRSLLDKYTSDGKLRKSSLRLQK